MNTKDHKIIAKGKRNLERRLARRGPEADGGPVLRGGNYHYEMAGRTRRFQPRMFLSLSSRCLFCGFEAFMRWNRNCDGPGDGTV